MRIISGTARGKRLASFQGDAIRPTPDRVREAVFSILVSRMGKLQGIKVLDLFAGTGAMALEALSRGAEKAVLVDPGPEAQRVIPSNLHACRLQERSTFIRLDALSALSRLPDPSYDLIFLDPPYGQGLAEKTITEIDRLELLAPEGILCAETDRREQLPESFDGLVLDDRRIYGSTAVHLFIHPPETSAP